MKKNDKKAILIITVLAFCILTWFIATGSYENGEFISQGINRAGIFDFFLMFYYAFYYKGSTIFYLFSIGALYGVATETKAYRKLVSKTSALIAYKEHIAMLVITFLMALYTSLTNDIMALLVVSPFIVTVFLRRGCDRLTSISAGFGGLFIGMFGQTFGTYAYNYLMGSTEVTITSGLWYKIVMFVLAYGLYNLFAIIHMKNRVRNPKYVQFDMFPIKKLDESKMFVSERTRVWPVITLFGIGLLVVLLAFINWETSFKVTAFSNALDSIKNFTIGDVTVFSSLLGNFTAFGNWDVLGISFIILITIIILAIGERMSINDFATNVGSGMKKISRVVFVYLLAQAVFVCYYYFPWPVTVISKLFTEKFNVFSMLLCTLINGTLAVDFEYATFMINSIFAINYSDYLLPAALLVRFGYSLVNLVAPTSCVLLIALSYLNVPYKKWIGYIWKYAVLMLALGLVIISLLAYV